MPECPSSARVPKCPSTLSAWVPKCPSAWSTQMPWVPECPSSLRVPEYPSALWMPNFPLSAIRVKNVWNITRNRLANNFIEFLKTFQNTTFYITLIVFNFLGNMMYKFYHILLSRYNNTKGFQKFSVNIVKFQKTKYDGVRSSLLSTFV